MIIEKLGMEKYVSSFDRHTLTEEFLTQPDRIQRAIEQVSWTFRKVFPYILIGVGIGSFIHNWIPSNWIETAFDSWFSVPLVTLLGIPMYADIFGIIPIAEALLNKGANLGTTLAFMMAVTTLSLPSMIMLSKIVQPKLMKVFVAICTVGIILVGYIFNLTQIYFN